ncbi:hypothetical protein PR048_025909 [Dryococelus australis]|uniref:Uncharacterized protein n=1 Tax=Dryococelus australis TaxID=614101 RepID=A0ABQ9GJW5_9NEOP|nr:hypothetical protein PR048_025909 [Dryococelus australis]
MKRCQASVMIYIPQGEPALVLVKYLYTEWDVTTSLGPWVVVSAFTGCWRPEVEGLWLVVILYEMLAAAKEIEGLLVNRGLPEPDDVNSHWRAMVTGVAEVLSPVLDTFSVHSQKVPQNRCLKPLLLAQTPGYCSVCGFSQSCPGGVLETACEMQMMFSLTAVSVHLSPNERAEETRDLHENSPTNSIVQHNSTCENPVTRPGIGPGLTVRPPRTSIHVATRKFHGFSRQQARMQTPLLHQGEPGSIPGKLTPRFVHVVIVLDDAAGRLVFSGISYFQGPCIPALLHKHLASPSSAFKTSLPRVAQTSPPLNKHYEDHSSQHVFNGTSFSFDAGMTTLHKVLLNLRTYHVDTLHATYIALVEGNPTPCAVLRLQDMLADSLHRIGVSMLNCSPPGTEFYSWLGKGCLTRFTGYKSTLHRLSVILPISHAAHTASLPSSLHPCPQRYTPFLSTSSHTHTAPSFLPHPVTTGSLEFSLFYSPKLHTVKALSHLFTSSVGGKGDENQSTDRVRDSVFPRHTVQRQAWHGPTMAAYGVHISGSAMHAELPPQALSPLLHPTNSFSTPFLNLPTPLRDTNSSLNTFHSLTDLTSMDCLPRSVLHTL